jgi:putative inorganic carbon (HCO3(-)) transporter
LAAQIDWPRWAYAGTLGLVAMACGVAAGLDPTLSIRVALGIAFLVIAFTDLSLGLGIFIFASFVGLYPYSRYDAAARVILGIAWLAFVLTRKRSELNLQAVHPIAAAALILFIAWSFLSVAWSEDTDDALLSATQYALSGIVLVVTYTAVRTKADLGRVLIAFLLGAVAAVIYALLEPSAYAEGRLANSIQDPNLLGESLVCGLAIAAAVIAMYRSPALRALGILCTIPIGVGILLTTSRSALIALGAALLAAIVLAGRWRGAVLLITVLLAASTYVYFVQFAPESARQRIEEPLQGQQRSEDGRNTIWQLAFRVIEDKPITGVGAGNFQVVQVRYLLRPGVERARTRTSRVIDDPGGKVAHNSFLSVMSELGAVGTILFVFLIGFAAVSMLKAAALSRRAGDHRMWVVAIALLVALVGSLTVQMFQSDQQGKVLWLLLGLGPAVLAVARNGATEPQRSPPVTQPARPALPAYSSS